jgi:two-component system sensor histidine kinase EvgS
VLLLKGTPIKARNSNINPTVVRIVAIYALFGGLWIYLSDTILGGIVHNPDIITRVAMFKGLLFILLTATLLYLLISRYVRQFEVSERSLQESEKRFRSIFELAAVGVALVDPSIGKFVKINSKFCDIVGYSVEEMLGKTFQEITHPNDLPADLDNTARLLAGELKSFSREKRYIHRNGSLVWVNLTVSLLWLEGQEPSCQIVVVEDISERKRAQAEKADLEARLQQAQKMESVGRLAGGVAHDFNNMLCVILGHAGLALGESDPAQPLHAHLMEICKAAERSAELTRQLLAFARKQTIAPIVLDLNETVSGMFKMLQRLIGEDIQLYWQPAPDLWPIKADPTQIDQILANLCVNARDSIADVGTITIESENSVIDENWCAHYGCSAPGEYVRLSVCDDGVGMDKETLGHIFEPFFTTKGAGEGTGLGLATVYGAVKQNNGFINVYSEPGLGATFSIYLPRHAGKPARVRTDDAAGPAPRGLEAILLVEDDPAILNVTSMLLEKLGYTVLAASTPGEAVRLAREHAGEINLLMTDVVMPEMNGRDLAQSLMSLYPQLKCLFMSGYTADVIAHHGVLEAGVHFLHKPFTLPVLAAKVREALDSE